MVTEGTRAGISAVMFLKGKKMDDLSVPVKSGEDVFYVVPHKINREAFQQEQVFQLRVKIPDEKVVLGIQSGEKLLKKSRFKCALPIEMITMTLPPIDLEKIDGEITISVLSSEVKE